MSITRGNLIYYLLVLNSKNVVGLLLSTRINKEKKRNRRNPHLDNRYWLLIYPAKYRIISLSDYYYNTSSVPHPSCDSRIDDYILCCLYYLFDNVIVEVHFIKHYLPNMLKFSLNFIK